MPETISITDEAKEVITTLCNEAVKKEYDMILRYSRIIDHMVNYEKVEDQQLINAIDKLAKDSLRHFTRIDSMMKNLGSNFVWASSILPKLVSIQDELEKQLIREFAVHDLYAEARKIAQENQTIAKTGGLFSGLEGKDLSEPSVIHFNQIIGDLDYLIPEKAGHIEIVMDSLATCKALKSR